MTSGLEIGQLEALAAHGLDEDGELQLAAAHHLEGVRGVGGLHADGDVGEQLLLQPLRMLREVTHFPSRPAKGEVLTEKIIERVGSSMCSGGQRRRGLGGGDRLADGDALDAGQGHDLAAVGALRPSTRFRPSNAKSLVTLVVCRRAVALGDRHRVADAPRVPEKMRPMPRRPR